MKGLSRVGIVTALSAVFSSGCAAYRVKVNAYLSHDLPFPHVQEGRGPRVAVVVGSEPQEPLLEAEVTRKIEFLLGEADYEVASEDESPYLLTCWLSIDKGVTQTEWETMYAGRHFGYVYTHHGRWGSASIAYPGVSYQVPYTYAYFTRFLGLTLYERQRWQAAEDDNVGDAAVWTCTATSVGSSTDLRSIANYLLAAAFDRFGEDTGREVRIRFRPDDQRLQEIAEAGR